MRGKWIERMFRIIRMLKYGKTKKDKAKLLLSGLLIISNKTVSKFHPNTAYKILQIPLEVDIEYNQIKIRAKKVEDIKSFLGFLPLEKKYSGFEGIRKAVGKDKKKRVGIDVGANIGIYTLFMSSLYKKVIAIEPYLSAFESLSLNSREEKNVYAINKAAMSKKAKIKLYLCPYGSGENSTKARFKKSVKVEADTLDNIIADLNIKPSEVSFIKIDVEGAELEVLKGATEILRKAKPVILFEAWDEKAFEKVKEYLETFGYKEFEKVSKGDYVAKV